MGALGDFLGSGADFVLFSGSEKHSLFAHYL
jgi:hypothetical protein